MFFLLINAYAYFKLVFLLVKYYVYQSKVHVMCPDKHETTNTLEMEWGKQASFTLQTFFKIGSMCMEAGLRNSSEPRMSSFAGYFLLYYRRIPTGEAVCIARLAGQPCSAELEVTLCASTLRASQEQHNFHLC